MPAPTTVAELIELVQKSGVIDAPRLAAYVQQLQDSNSATSDLAKLANLMIRDGILTYFQAEQFLLGKWKGFTIGKYKVLEKLGSGGMGQVYLAEHKLMRRKVALKVLPSAKARDPSSLERFHREARAVAALDHPNLVRAFDIDQDESDTSRVLHYLVMEYVDGASLQEVVKRSGPLDPSRACYYMHQAAEGLQYAYEVAELIHRDIKPANIMVDRQGLVKILDMGLARFFNDDEDNLTKKYDENILGTADYLSPEQATDSHTVDIRADMYGLGATFYYILTGKPPFPDGSVAQKLIWHQTRQPTPIRLIRQEVPEGVSAILERMMMKDPASRYQTPAELAGALAPFVPTDVAPPSESELPKMSPAAVGVSADAPKEPPKAPATATSPPKVPSGRWGMPAVAMRPPPLPHTDLLTESPAPRPKAPSGMHRPGSGLTRPPALPSSPAPPDRTDANPFANLLGGTEPAAQNAYATAASRAPTLVQAPVTPPNSGDLRGRWLIVGAILFAALALGSFAVIWLTRNAGGARDSDSAAGPPVRHARRLTVSRDSQRGEFQSVAAALFKSQPGDEVILMDPVHEEPGPLTFDARHGKGVSIKSGQPEGRGVVWQVPLGKPSGWMIELNNCEDTVLQGLTLDGRGVVDAPLRLVGFCAGTTIQDLLIQQFRQAAIKFANCGGEAVRPIQLIRVRATAETAEADSALSFFANPSVTRPKANEHITIRNCRLEGPFKAAMIMDGSAEAVSIENCRLWNATEGLRLKELSSNVTMRVSLSGNTFADIKEVLVAGNAPDDGRSRIVLQQNLFANCGTVLKIEKGPRGRFITATSNGRDKGTKNGQLPAAAKEFVVEFISANPTRTGFLSYPKDHPLAKAGPNGTPIGVPAD